MHADTTLIHIVYMGKRRCVRVTILSSPIYCQDLQYLVGGLEHLDYFILFSHMLGMSSSQLTNSIIFQRGRLNHQPDINLSYGTFSNYGSMVDYGYSHWGFTTKTLAAS